MPTDVRELLRDAAATPHERPDFHAVWRTGRRRRLAMRVGGLAAAALVLVGGLVAVADLAGLTGESTSVFVGEPSRVAVLEELPDSPTVVAERETDGVRAVLTAGPDEVCLAAGPVDEDELEARRGPLSCGDDFRAQLEERGIALPWLAQVGGSDPRREIFAALVPDGFDQAVSHDGRTWSIEQNLLVIIVSLDDTAAIEERDSLPSAFVLRGPAGAREVALTDLFPQGSASSSDCDRFAQAAQPLISDEEGVLRVELFVNEATASTCVWDISRDPPVATASSSGSLEPPAPDDALVVVGSSGGVRVGQPPGTWGTVGVVYGRVSDEVATVTVTRQDGRDVAATLTGGYFLAWWEHPTEITYERVVAYDADGQPIADDTRAREP